MTIRLVRSVACAAVIAGPVAALQVALPIASAAPKPPSPYTGTYTGGVTYSGGGTEGFSKPYWRVTAEISSSGRVSGVANYFAVFPGSLWGLYTSPEGDGSISGTISADGSVRISVSDGKYGERFNDDVTVGSDGQYIFPGHGGGLVPTLVLVRD